jgi:hypothetical protein
MTSVRLQDVGDILLGIKNGKKPFERVRKEHQRNDRFFRNLEIVLSGVGSRSQKRWLTTNGEEALTYTLATCPYHIGEHGLASLAECGVRLLTLFRQNCYTGIIRRRFKQQVCDRL